MQTAPVFIYFKCFMSLQDRIAKMKQTEGKLEDDKKALKMMLEDAENRCTKLELARRSLEGDLQRLKLVLTDKETENQVSTYATGVENVCFGC